jgi:SsrA-binding protein
VKIIAENRKALALYEFSKKFEAGIKLLGPEVKSVRLGRVMLTGSYVKIINNMPVVVGMRISAYPKAFEKHKLDPLRTRFLLLRKKEISRLGGFTSQKGLAVVPLKVYIKNNLVKLEIGVGRGLKKYDRREKLKRKQLDRQVERALRGKL